MKSLQQQNISSKSINYIFQNCIKQLKKFVQNFQVLRMGNPIIFIICAITVTSMLLYYLFVRKPGRQQSYSQPSQIRRNREARGDQDECCICLAEQKKFQVSTTCGHSFCGKCLTSLHDHSNQKLKCPLCRDQINIIFRVFPHTQQPKQQRQQIQAKIREYNNKFQDNRSFSRRLSQFPFILNTLRNRLLRAEFITFFINNANLIKMIAAILIYLIVPIDLLPEYLLGAVGYLDDFGIIILIFLYTVANTAVEYVRRRE